MKKTNIIALNAPKITSAQREELTHHKKALETTIAEIEGDLAKVTDLRRKQAEHEKETKPLQRAAANFDSDSELKLLLNQKTLQRLRDAIASAEAECCADIPVYGAIDAAQDLVQKIC